MKSRLLTVLAIFTAMMAQHAIAQPQECSKGLARDGRAYLVCESQNEIRVKRTTSATSAFDSYIDTLVFPESEQTKINQNFYMRLGGAFSQGFDIKGNSGHFQLSLGSQLAENVRIDLTIEMGRRERLHENNFSLAIYSYRVKNPIFTTLTYDFQSFGKITPFVSLGAGFAEFKQFEHAALYSAPKKHVTAVAANFAAGFGFSVNVQENVNIDFSYRFSRFSPLASSKVLHRSNLISHDIVVGMRIPIL